MLPQSGELVQSLLLLFVAAIAGGFVAKFLDLPLIIGYITGGVIIGNLFARFLDPATIGQLADSGIILLLFALGIEFSFQRFRKIISIVGWAVVVQIVIVLVAVHLLMLALGFPFFVSFIVGAAASFSSTAIVIKLLAERGEEDTLHGEVVIAWLIIQDLAAVPIMLLLPGLVVASNNAANVVSTLAGLGVNVLKASTILLATLSFGRKLIPWVLHIVARTRSRELFVVVTTAIIFAAGLSMYTIGLSPALGAFLAGLLMAETSSNHAIFSEIRPLRDIFAVIFFVSIGIVLPISTIFHYGFVLLAVSLFILILKSGSTYILGRFVGLHKKTAFLASLALLPMSEFGFIIAREGMRLGVINQDYYAFSVMLAFITIFVAAPLTIRGPSLYYAVNALLISKFPRVFPGSTPGIEKREEVRLQDHVVLCGYGRVGRYIGRALEMVKIPYVVVDYNHATIAKLKERGVTTVYGDPGDKDVLGWAHVTQARALIIAIPDKHTQKLIIGHARTMNRGIHIICRSHHEEDQKYLKALGVDIVVQPEFEAAITVVTRLLSSYGVTADDIAGKVTRLKIEHGLG